jgi:predicted dehydrogenase
VSRTRQLSLGVLGLSPAWEAAYLPALQRLGARARLAAVTGGGWRAGGEAAKAQGARHVGSVRALFREELDGVLLTAVEGVAWFAIRTAIEAGRPAFVTLPATDDQSPLANLYAAAHAAGVLVMPELRLRYTPATLRLRELLATELGPVQEVEIRSLSQAISAGPRVEAELIDWCRVVMGCAPQVVACRDVSGAKPFGARTLTLGFDPPGRHSRVLATITLPAAPGTVVGALPPADLWPLEFSVRCKYGEARLEDAAQVRWREGGREQVESLSTERTAVSVAIDHFARRLAGGLIPVPDLSDVLLAVRVAVLAEQSRAAGGVEFDCRA